MASILSMPPNTLSRLRSITFSWPLATLAMLMMLVMLVINETGYSDAHNALSNLGTRGSVRIQIQTLMRQLVDAESGQRGYLLTGQEADLDPYQKAVEDVRETLKSLGDHYQANSLPAQLVRDIDRQAQVRLAAMSRVLDLHRQGQTAQWQALLRSDAGRQSMDALRQKTAILLALENTRIDTERQALFDMLQLSRIGVNVMGGVTLLALFLFLRRTQLLIRARQWHEQALKAEQEHLEAEVLRRTEELKALARHLQTVREDERSRLARELHDELGALLTATKLDMARLRRMLGAMPPEVQERLQHIHATLDQGIALKRRIIEDLVPSSLRNLGLASALKILASEFAQRADITVNTTVEPVSLSPQAEITLYRLVQESFTNIAKYARASVIDLSVVREGERVRVRVQDNGVGFDTNVVKRSAHGLNGMRFRVESAGGVMQIRSAPGRGTGIEAWLPATSDTTADAPATVT